jgi:hypothetical protein
MGPGEEFFAVVSVRRPSSRTACRILHRVASMLYFEDARAHLLAGALRDLLPRPLLAALIEAIQGLPQGNQAVPERHAVIAERIARVQAAGGVATLSVDEVEQSLRRDLDF